MIAVIKRKKNIGQNGFTVMELLVTVAIISIMSAIYLTSYRSTNQRIILDQAASGVVSDIRLAQNMAMNVKKVSGAIPVGGYGLRFTGPFPAASYIVFADIETDYNKMYSGISEKIADRMLPKNVFISAISFTGDIDFEPPNPTVWIDGATASTQATITLQYGVSGATRTITINRLTGQVSVLN